MNVKFISVGLKSSYLALATKDPSALYWIAETSELFKGGQLFGTGALATESAAGLLSPADYAKLQSLVVSGGGLSNLTAVDGTISITDTIGGGKAIGVSISTDPTNALVAVDGGLFVPTVVVPEYSIEKQEVVADGFTASYRLKKTVNGVASYVGDTINIGQNLVLKSATLETVTQDGVPYTEAKVGDPYIKLEFNDANASALYIPVKGLVDTYTAGSGIKIENNVISVKLADVTRGLTTVNGALALDLATRQTDGAMSAQDKLVVDSIPYAYETRKYDISSVPAGTLVDYRDYEIRVMCPADAEFIQQNVGQNGQSNMYYMTFKAYAPRGAVSFKEGDRGVIIDEMHTFDGPASGIDEFGRRYSVCWLALAVFDEVTKVWNYFGKNSTESKYIGWDYCVEWYSDTGVKIGFDSIRINLSNENCHYVNKPYYMNNVATVGEIEEIKATVAELQEGYSWGEL